MNADSEKPASLLLDPHPGQRSDDDQLLDLLGALEYVVGVLIAFGGNQSQANTGRLYVHYPVVRPLSTSTSPKLVLLRPSVGAHNLLLAPQASLDTRLRVRRSRSVDLLGRSGSPRPKMLAAASAAERH